MDHLSSLLTQLSSAQAARRRFIDLTPRHGGTSTFLRALLRLLIREGYLSARTDTSSTSRTGVTPALRVYLKYGAHGQPAIRARGRISRSSRRLSLSSSALWQPRSGPGLIVISTTHGLLTDRESRQRGLGGEPLRYVL
jgi:small subunit ribosomal protein S8